MKLSAGSSIFFYMPSYRAVIERKVESVRVVTGGIACPSIGPNVLQDSATGFYVGLGDQICVLTMPSPRYFSQRRWAVVSKHGILLEYSKKILGQEIQVFGSRQRAEIHQGDLMTPIRPFVDGYLAR